MQTFPRPSCTIGGRRGQRTVGGKAKVVAPKTTKVTKKKYILCESSASYLKFTSTRWIEESRENDRRTRRSAPHSRENRCRRDGCGLESARRKPRKIRCAEVPHQYRRGQPEPVSA